MFTVSDEILIWAKRNGKKKVYKLKLETNVKEKFVNLFNQGIHQLMYDGNAEELIPIPFETNYGVSAGEEHFVIQNFDLPQEIKDAVDASDTLETYVPKGKDGKTKDGFEIRALLIAGKNENGYYVAGQKFSQRQITVKKRGFGIFLAGDIFIEDNREFVISVGEQVDCVFVNAGLIFEKYFDANGVFDLGDYYRSASQGEIDTFTKYETLYISDLERFSKSVNAIQMRKKVAKILDLGTLNDVKRIRDNAAKVNLPINFTADGNKIDLPVDKKELRKIMAFLAEELYPGMFTNNTYLTNSTRQII